VGDRISSAIEDARAAPRPSATWVDVLSSRTSWTSRRPRSSVSPAGVGVPVDDGLRATLDHVRGASRQRARRRPSRVAGGGEHPAEIEALLPRIAAAARSRGYEVDARTGDVTLRRP